MGIVLHSLAVLAALVGGALLTQLLERWVLRGKLNLAPLH